MAEGRLQRGLQCIRFLAVTLIAAGCAGIVGYEPLGLEKADRSYKTYPVVFTIGNNQQRATIYYKATEHQGRVKACGYLLSRELTGYGVRMANSLLDAGTFSLGDDAIGPSAFVRLKNTGRDDYDAEAYCVLFNTLWKDLYSTASPKFGAQYQRVIY
ncbi:MAG: hypothetical protein EXQ86_05780 [Rhodospirillales bacterium]|nr:hypothetical protein [Rhodospirillales bacterium]